MNNDYSISKSICHNLDIYFSKIDDISENESNNVWEMVISCVEKTLLENIMEKTEGNQSKASKILGINRSTLRKKLISYKLLDNDRE